MEVIAIKPGFHGKLRQVDDKFDVPKGSKASWFEPVATKPSKDKADERPADEPAAS